ncbi:hypothetical protein G5I_02886 [Acromyrmex echinatior]|uniref:Uncharacterized protein n=1 Tax=Acromyrmex echinatior TaxID=103372 RepID=F4WBH4_ACREC|nr:hypothetical protein G5I_02886 [Acromyrmex echinatior]
MEREGDPPLAAAPYKVRPDETINSIRQKRAPGTPVFSVSRSILRILTFRELCSPLHQGEQQPNTEEHPDEVDCKVHETLAFQEWI